MHNNMNEEIIESVAESRGYDRGYVTSRRVSHDLMNSFIEHLKHQQAVLSADNVNINVGTYDTIMKQINILEHAKYIIRRGDWEIPPADRID